MTLHVVSGLPGHGKTLYTLHHVEQLRRESGRPVYVHGVNDLQLKEWQHLEDPTKWHLLPDGCIVVIDEAWRFFPKRGAGSQTPTHVQELATHRHRGFDLFLVSQNPGLQLDHFARGLVGAHYHLRRVFGGLRSRLYRWERLANPDDWHDRKEAIKTWFRFPREVFGWYKSAEVHTVKRKLPWTIIGPTIVAVALLPLMGLFVYRSLYGSAQEVSEEQRAAAGVERELGAEDNPFIPAVSRGGRGQVFGPESFEATVPGIPWTVPAYAAGLSVTTAPRIAGCGVLKIGTRVQCRCNDQQGNEVDLEHRVCLAYFKRGAFDPAEDGNRYPVYEPYIPRLAPPLDQGGGGPADQPKAGGGPTP